MNSDLLRRNVEHPAQCALHHRIALGRDVDVIDTARGIIRGDAALRLHRNAAEPRAIELHPGNMSGRLKRRGGLGFVAIFEIKCNVVRQLVVQFDCARRDGVLHLDDRGTNAVIDDDLFHRILRSGDRFRDHEGDFLADIPDAISRKAGMKRRAHLHASLAGKAHQVWRILEPCRDHIGAGEHT